MEFESIVKIIAENEAYANIVGRTSIREFTDDYVSDTIRSALLHAAMSAPSGVNRQPWEFVVVDDRDMLRQLADRLPYAKMVAHAPMAIVVCGNTERFLDGDDSTLWEQDLSAASENILLAAHALGLGAVWTCLYPHADRVNTVRQLLHIPDSVIPFNLIPVGYPAGHHHPMDKWQPDRVHYNTY